jgi:hypothetical protein
MTFLTIVFGLAAVALLVLWLRVKSEAATLATKLAESERQFADLRAANDVALRDAEASLAKEREDMERETERMRAHYQAEATRLIEDMARDVRTAKEEAQRLESLRGLGRDEAEARATLATALQEAEELRAIAQSGLDSARSQARIEQDAAIARAKEIRAQAERLLSRANTDAAKIVEDAHKSAEKIGGDAYLALRERDRLEESIKAIRNVIGGYGDRYVVPTRSIIDDLAADFGHTEAGQALAVARAESRRMVEEGQAGECDYAESARRETAIRFAVDAFNGRVDAVLSEVGHENVGTLEQQIRDIFSVVNLNGAAFRNARISAAYLNARLLELKWAAAVNELKIMEREEQRRIREQIREEERARREFEKAVKDAQREEDILKQALEKARKEVAEASADEKAKLEKQMAELAQKLAEAEAKGQRAISMAQQTRKGNVYIISNVGSFGDGVLKIGMTRRLEPMERVWELGDASVPFEFDVHAIIPSDDAPALEGELHQTFDDCRVNQVNLRKEFFRVSLEKVRELVTKRSMQAHFTMAAEAQEYRESQAIAAMNPEERERYRSARGNSLPKPLAEEHQQGTG